MLKVNMRKVNMFLILMGLFVSIMSQSQEMSRNDSLPLLRYYGHQAVLDSHGVIAPWYSKQNGQCDLRIRVAAETIKRYPWTTKENAVASYPKYIFTSMWQISPDGEIAADEPDEWMNGDLGQRLEILLKASVEYFRYSGDPASISQMTYAGDFLLDYCLTPENHSWPNFPISVPTKGKVFGKANPDGMIQLDFCAGIGEALLQAYKITKKQSWLDATKHWGDLFAQNCNFNANTPPWPRYANPDCVKWRNSKNGLLQTGGVTKIISFLDELIRIGYLGKDNKILYSRDAGITYLRDQLLPQWSQDNTWGHNYWDWVNETQTISVSFEATKYIINHKQLFPNWRNDTRNILTIFLNRSTASPLSNGDVYNGAWAFPEASNCCKRSLWYSPLYIGLSMAQYGVVANDVLMKELGYRQFILQTYDIHENGISEDNIDGGVIVNKRWFSITHPTPLMLITQAIGWLPEELGASRENHLVRTTSVVDNIVYGKDSIIYSTFDSPTETIDVFRLSYTPTKILADGEKLNFKRTLNTNGYTVKKMSNGDAIVSIRHDSMKKIILYGNDPQTELHNIAIKFDTYWNKGKDITSSSGAIVSTNTKDAFASVDFVGNQVRIIGRVDQFGGYADVYIDDEKQIAFIDFWNPTIRGQQVVFYRNGLENRQHSLKIVARGTGNPYAKNNLVYIDKIQFSTESEVCNFPTGTGSTYSQRMIFGYTKRKDYKDTKGHSWKPGTEVVTRISDKEDTVEKCWWKTEAKNSISGTTDPELYRYGIHSKDFWVNVTVGPGKYDVRLKFAVAQDISKYKDCFDIFINDNIVVKDFNVYATAGGLNKAVDLVFKNILPKQGIIKIRFKGSIVNKDNSTEIGEAYVQALEVCKKIVGKGATPICVNE